MKNYHFFLEYPTAADRRKATRKNLGNHCGTVFAAIVRPMQWVPARPGAKWADECFEGISSTFFRPDSPVSLSSVSNGYKWAQCLRISEAQARIIHPELFKRLDT